MNALLLIRDYGRCEGDFAIVLLGSLCRRCRRKDNFKCIVGEKNKTGTCRK